MGPINNEKLNATNFATFRFSEPCWWRRQSPVMWFGTSIVIILLLNEEFEADLGSWLRCGEATIPVIWPETGCIPVKNTLSRRAVVFCACEITDFSAVSRLEVCIIWLYACDIEHVTNGEQRKGHAATETRVLTGTGPSSRVLRASAGIFHAGHIICILFSHGQ